MDDYKRTHIPAFGNWDYEDGMPITQYFESARQAGLLRYTYGEEGDLYSGYPAYPAYYDGEVDLYLKPATAAIAVVPHRKTKGSLSESGKEQRKQGRVHDLTLTSSTPCVVQTAPKAVDEDLYKIPPELLYSTTHKKRRTFGFFTRCLMPSCVV